MAILQLLILDLINTDGPVAHVENLPMDFDLGDDMIMVKENV